MVAFDLGGDVLGKRAFAPEELVGQAVALDQSDKVMVLKY